MAFHNLVEIINHSEAMFLLRQEGHIYWTEGTIAVRDDICLHQYWKLIVGSKQLIEGTPYKLNPKSKHIAQGSGLGNLAQEFEMPRGLIELTVPRDTPIGNGYSLLNFKSKSLVVPYHQFWHLFSITSTPRFWLSLNPIRIYVTDPSKELSGMFTPCGEHGRVYVFNGSIETIDISELV